jgi:hypothetical protein
MDLSSRPFLRDVYRDMAPEIVVMKGAQLGMCLDEESELLSRRGWLRWDEVRLGEDVLTFDLASETTRWSPVTQLYVDPDYEGDMVEIQGRHLDALVTPGHRWAVRHHSNPYGYRMRETSDLKGSDTIPIRAAHRGFPESSPFEDAFVELVGWIVTDGTYRRDTPGTTTIRITQREGNGAESIRRVFAELGLPPRERAGVGRQRQFAFSGPIAAAVRSLLPTKELTASCMKSCSTEMAIGPRRRRRSIRYLARRRMPSPCSRFCLA